MPSPDSRSTMASLRNSSVSPSSAWNQFAPGTPERSNTTGSSATIIPSVSCMSATAIPRLCSSMARIWRYDGRTASHMLDLGRDLRDAQPGVDEGARGLRPADLLSIPVDLMRRRNLGMSQVSIRPAIASDHAAVLALADRLPAFGPPTRPASEIVDREHAALATALSQPVGGSAILVAEQPSRGVVGVILLDSRRDYFTNEAHGHVAILAVAREAEGQGLGRPLLQAGEDWARANRYSKLTLAVFKDNERAKQVRARDLVQTTRLTVAPRDARTVGLPAVTS